MILRVMGLMHIIGRSVSNRSSEAIIERLRIYLALVRPQLNYAVHYYRLYYRIDIDL